MATTINSLALDSRQALAREGTRLLGSRNFPLSRKNDDLYSPWRMRLSRNAESILEANRKDVESSGLDGAYARPFVAEFGAHCVHGAGHARCCGSSRSGLGNFGGVDASQRHSYSKSDECHLGVVGIIYESRPNVTADTVALAFKTGNAIVLRGGKEAAHSNQRIVEILTECSRAYLKEQLNSGFKHARFCSRIDQGARIGRRADSPRRTGAYFLRLGECDGPCD